jgi:hypothetical protein
VTITLRDAPAQVLAGVRTPSAPLRCVVCGHAFDFAAGESAVVMRHVAYGHDFVHDGRCLAIARDLLFAEPGYDSAALGRDPQRRRILDAGPAAGWAAVLPEPPQRIGPGRPVQLVDGRPVHLEPLRWWALIEHEDGSRHVEGIVRDEDWLDEPGGAELPEARAGFRRLLGYAAPADLREADARPRAA